jgi:hypothetical protein
VAHSAELPRIGRHQRRTTPASLASQQYVVRADRLAERFELCPNTPCLTGIILVELRKLEGTCEKRLQPLRVALLTLTLVDAIPQLEGDD